MEAALVFNERVAAYYEQWYTTAKGAHFDAVEKRILKSALSVVRSGSLLEVGCGTGHFSRFFAELGFNVFGVDVSVPMIEEAKRHHAGVSYIDADAHNLPFTAGCFDVVVFVTTIEFLARPMKAIEEALRVARKLVIVGFLNRYSLTAMRRRVYGFFKKGLFSTAKFYSAGELTRLIKLAGLESDRAIEFLKPQASYLNIGGLKVGAFAGVGARLPAGS